MYKLVTQAMVDFLTAQRSTHPAPDLLDRFLEHGTDLETQINVDPANSEPVAGKRATWDTGTYQYWNLRIPKNAHAVPEFKDYKLSWPLELHADKIGSTGWHWRNKVSLWVGFDFDAITGHAKGRNTLTDEKLAEVQRAAEDLPYIEVRRSTGGKGIHLYVLLDSIPTANHTEHAALAKLILTKMGADTGFNFPDAIDCYGHIMWFWAANMPPNAYRLLSPSTRVLTTDDLPDLPPTRERTPDTGDQTGGINWDRLCDPVPPIREGTGHRRIIDQLGAHCTWDADHKCYRTHTARLAQVEHHGEFDTVSEGTDPATPNCYMFPRPNGAFLVRRFGNPAETDGWEDGNGHPQRKYNEAPPTLRFLTCQQLDSTKYHIQYLIDNTLVAGQPAIIGGPKKALKTSLAIDMAISLATGEPFLGRMEVNVPCKTLLLSGESGMSTLQETARRICQSKNVNLPDIKNLYWSDWLPQLDNAKQIDTLGQTIAETGAKVLIVDPLYLCMSGTDAGNLFVQGGKFTMLTGLCQRHAVTPILLHHTRKRGKGDRSYEPPELDDLAWAGFAEFARQWMLIGRRGAYQPGTGQHALWLSIGGSAGHSAQWAVDVDEGVRPRHWTVEISTPSAARAEKRETTIRERIIVAARNYPTGEVITTILDTAGLKKNQPQCLIFQTMVEESVLVPIKIKRRNGQTYEGFRLAEVTP